MPYPRRFGAPVALLVAAVLTLIASAVQAEQRGIASFYDCRQKGECSPHKIMANGRKFNPGAFTAAHRALPFGTMVRVTNLRNGRSVTVRITDRGPFIRGRIIDLTPVAARAIGITASGGVAAVTVSRHEH